MKILKDIIYKVALTEVRGSTGIEINKVCFDSSKVSGGDLFIALKGIKTDGHNFIPSAIDKGAKAIVCEHMPEEPSDGITYLTVRNSSEALGIIAANFYEQPSLKLKLIGITGTNGKTTTTTLLFELFLELGFRAGLISTVKNQINNKIYTSVYTTPDALQINYLLGEMVKEECTHCFMEVSSHSIVQNRIMGLNFAGGIFTNITHEHLDFHKTFDAYIKAKKSFFDNLPYTAFALVNTDDVHGKTMIQNTKANKKTYALTGGGDFKCKIEENTLFGLFLQIDGKEVFTRLIGSFNAYNILSAYGTALLLGLNKEDVLRVLSKLEPVKGRFQQVVSPNGIMGIVDYAHTPDALQNVLDTIKEVKESEGGIITVVGCGGDRDKTKRAIMASIACEKSDRVILTSDNPRTEEPINIINDMGKGLGIIERKKTLLIVDRREAIKTACSMAHKGDIILLAGKGHEDYQEIKGVKYPFDDFKELQESFNKLKG